MSLQFDLRLGSVLIFPNQIMNYKNVSKLNIRRYLSLMKMCSKYSPKATLKPIA